MTTNNTQVVTGRGTGRNVVPLLMLTTSDSNNLSPMPDCAFSRDRATRKDPDESRAREHVSARAAKT
jgi:hypothetical protein